MSGNVIIPVVISILIIPAFLVSRISQNFGRRSRATIQVRNRAEGEPANYGGRASNGQSFPRVPKLIARIWSPAGNLIFG
jgi:hypothetical protein